MGTKRAQAMKGDEDMKKKKKKTYGGIMACINHV